MRSLAHVAPIVAVALFAARTAAAAEIVQNYAALCPEPSALGPGPGEEGHVAATRLEPPGYPFTVTAVRARLHHGQLPNARCTAEGAHRIDLWVSSEPAPSANPDFRAALTFGPEEVLGEERQLSAVLDAPIVLQDGEYLFASVDFGGRHPDVGCIATCRTYPSPDASFWSNASQPPYDWRTLDDFGIRADLWIEAVGEGPARPVAPEPVAPTEPAPAPTPPPPGRRRR